MAEAFLIEDGYTLPFKIERVAGLHPELRGTFRPALDAERNRYMKEAQDLDKRAKAKARLVCEHVCDWNVRTRAGAAVEKPDAKTAEILHPELLGKLVDVILLYSASGEEAADRGNS